MTSLGRIGTSAGRLCRGEGQGSLDAALGAAVVTAGPVAVVTAVGAAVMTAVCAAVVTAVSAAINGKY